MLQPPVEFDTWLKRAVVKHFAVLPSIYYNGLPLNEVKGTQVYRLEVSGPTMVLKARSITDLHYSIQILIHSTPSLYTREGNTAAARVRYSQTIPVLDDSDLEIGCLKLEGNINIAHFGQPSPDSQIEESTIDAGYVFTYEE